MKINLKYHILISNLLEILSIAVLVSPVFFMHYNIKIITYGYLPLEFISIFLLLRYNKWEIYSFYFLYGNVCFNIDHY